jgi:hypothetical protein
MKQKPKGWKSQRFVINPRKERKMRVNVYAEEITDKIEIVEKNGFTGVRFYLELPVTQATPTGVTIHRGPFQHHEGDDDSAAVTFWGKKDLRKALLLALEALDKHYAKFPFHLNEERV